MRILARRCNGDVAAAGLFVTGCKRLWLTARKLAPRGHSLRRRIGSGRVGAHGRTRTGTAARPLDFKSNASASFATCASGPRLAPVPHPFNPGTGPASLPAGPQFHHDLLQAAGKESTRMARRRLRIAAVAAALLAAA